MTPKPTQVLDHLGGFGGHAGGRVAAISGGNPGGEFDRVAAAASSFELPTHRAPQYRSVPARIVGAAARSAFKSALPELRRSPVRDGKYLVEQRQPPQ